MGHPVAPGLGTGRSRHLPARQAGKRRMALRDDPGSEHLANRPLAEQDEVAGRDGPPLLLLPVHRQWMGAHHHALAALHAPLAQVDEQLGVAEGEPVVGRQDLPHPDPRRLAVGVDRHVVPVGEHAGEVAALVDAPQPLQQDARVGLAQALPAPLGEAVHQLAEDELGVGGAHRLEGSPGPQLEPVAQRPGVAEEPVAPPPGPQEGLGVGVGDGAPGGPPHVQQEDGGLEVLPGLDQLGADRAAGRRRLLEHGRGRLAARVVADAPAVGRDLALGQAAEIEGRRELAFEGHREEVGHFGSGDRVTRPTARPRGPERTPGARFR